MSRTASERPEIRLARPEERRAGLALLLSADGRPADEAQIVEFTRFAEQRQIQLDRLWIAARAGRIRYALLPIPSPGKTALLFLPARSWDAESSESLVAAATDWCVRTGIELVQLLIDPLFRPVRQGLAELAFQEMAELIYLQILVPRHDAYPPLPPGCAWELYSAESHGRFAAAISDSYRDSLDCPALSGLRDIEDVIAGHKAAGEFDPRFWFILRRHGEPVAVLLLNRITGGVSAELTYLGVNANARRTGIGKLLVRHAIAAASAMGVHSLTLAVDSRNAPALSLYFKHGFKRVARKLAMMRDLRDVAPARK